jgi:hypothetical protein
MNIKTSFKLLSASLAFLIATPIFAVTTPPLCTLINGLYSGTYTDPTHLFPAKAFPLNLYLIYQKNRVYGFTLPANDKDGAHYGQKPFYLVWGNCSNDTISNLYVIANRPGACGDPATESIPLPTDGSLKLTLYYENAMIGASLKAELTPSKILPDAEVLSMEKQKTLLNQAMTLSKEGVTTCH